MLEGASWLFLDLDGTLADSLGNALATYHRFARAFAFEPTEAEFRSLNGPSLPEIVEVLRERHAIERAGAELVVEYRQIWLDGLASVAPKPGALALLDAAAGHKLSTAIVTSGSAAFVERFLANVEKRVDLVVTGDDVARAKPDPEIYRRALARAGCPAVAAVAVEDSVNGVESATAAGIRTIALADETEHATSAEALRNAGAVQVVRSLAEVFA